MLNVAHVAARYVRFDSGLPGHPSEAVRILVLRVKISFRFLPDCRFSLSGRDGGEAGETRGGETSR